MNIASMTFKELVNTVITSFLQPAVALLMALAVLYFLYGIFLFVREKDKTEKLQELKDRVVWGIIALAVMTSVFGLVQVVVNTFFSGSSVPSSNNYQIPSNLGPATSATINAGGGGIGSVDFVTSSAPTQ